MICENKSSIFDAIIFDRWLDVKFKLNKRQSDLLKSANKSSLFKKTPLNYYVSICFLIYKKSDNILNLIFLVTLFRQSPTYFWWIFPESCDVFELKFPFKTVSPHQLKLLFTKKKHSWINLIAKPERPIWTNHWII